MKAERMAEGNGDKTRDRLQQLEEMDKLLLRAQVLQQRALEILQETIERHEGWQARQETWREQQGAWNQQQQRWREESEARWARIETARAEANEKVNFLIDREMRREGGREARG